MTIFIAHLGPSGTYTEQAALAYISRETEIMGKAVLCPYPSIAQTLKAVAQGQATLGVVPVENSVEGGVAITLDMVWRLDMQIQLALEMPIIHALLSSAPNIESIETVYSHPQALAQCQGWLEQFLPTARLIATNSNTEALPQIEQDTKAGAIASSRAAGIYHLPILASAINDYPDNCTRFWVVSTQSMTSYHHSSNPIYTSLAFSLGANIPGSLVKALQIFAQRGINLSRIESRPSKRALGEYIFFIDLESQMDSAAVQSALLELTTYTEVLKLFGSYRILSL